MIQVKTYLSTILAIVILAASLLPALHLFNHEISSEGDTASVQVSKASVDCELCDFRLVTSDAPPIYAYEVHSFEKETSHTLSLAENVNLFSNPLFSLRAPPVVIS